MYEVMMAEWGIPWDHIDTTWTDRQFVLFSRVLVARKKREAGTTEHRPKPEGKVVKFKDWIKGLG